MTICYTLDPAPCSGFVRTKAAFLDLAEQLGVDSRQLTGLAWWRNAGEENDFVHPNTLERFAQKAIELWGYTANNVG